MPDTAQTEAALPTTLFGPQHLNVFDGADWIAFDSETTRLQPEVGGLRLVQLAAPGRPVVVVDVWEGGLEALQAVFEVERRWYAHNAVFDLSWLQEHGIVPAGDVFCTMLASRLLNNGIPNVRNGLAPVVERYLSRELSKEQQKSDWSAPTLTTEQLTYAAEDVRTLVDLVPVLTQRLHVARLLRAYSLECKALAPIAQMQRTGIPFNRAKLEALRDSYTDAIETLGKRFVEQLDAAMPEAEKLPREPDGTYNLRAKAEGSVRLGTKRLAGFNLNSPKQLVHKLGVLLGSVPVDKTGKPSASRQALRAYAADHEVVQTYLAWKRAEKRRQMTVALLDHQAPDGFIRANYLQLGADTGRFSCREPNLQQVPRDRGFREAAEAPEGFTFVCADFGQMELRLLAAVSGDERMSKAFQDGEDLHTITAAAIYPEPTDDPAELKQRRQVAKSANFGLAYGSGAQGLREYAGSMGITMTLEEAAAIRDTFHVTYPGVSAWQQEAARTATRTSSDKWAEVRIPHSDLRRFLPGELNRLTTRCNTPIQGAGAAILKLALGRLWPLVRDAGEATVRLCAVVHDEVLLLCREDVADEWTRTLSETMERAEALWLGDIPPLADAAKGATWQDAK